MKKIKMQEFIFFLIFIFSSMTIYGQSLTMKIDSVDIAKGIAINDLNVSILLEDDYPFLRIATTITNDTESDVWIYEPDVWVYEPMEYVLPDMWLEFYYKNMRYHLKLNWINTNKPAPDGGRYKDYFGIYLLPHEEKRVVSWTPFPAESDLPQNSNPMGWTWEKKNSDADFLQWFREVLPTLRVICFYGQGTKDVKKLVSEPINLKTIRITTNLKNERVN